MLPNAVRWLWLGLVPLACGPGPLPPENPKTQPDTQAPPIAIQIDPAPPNSAAPVTATPAPEPARPIVVKGVGFQTPESVLYVAEADRYFVSNINGSPTGVDNNGFISKLNPDGSLDNLKFIAGGTDGVQLNAPKGMIVVGDTLYVADITELRRFDVKTGAAKGSIRFPKATFLNDVAADPSGTLYVTDSGLKTGASGLEPTGTDAIYKVSGEKVTVFAKGVALAAPNGIQADGEHVTTVTLGKNVLTRFDLNGKVEATAELPAGGLDGLIELPGGKYLVSSWQSQSVYAGDIASGFTAVLANLPSPADIGWSAKSSRVAVPLFLENEVHLMPFDLSAVSAKESASAKPVTAAVAPQAPQAAKEATATPAPATTVSPAAVASAAVAPAVTAKSTPAAAVSAAPSTTAIPTPAASAAPVGAPATGKPKP